MQANHSGDFPFVVAVPPHNYRLSDSGGGARFFCIVVKFMESNFYRSVLINGVYFDASCDKLSGYFATNISFGSVDNGLFRSHYAPLVVIKFDAIGKEGSVRSKVGIARVIGGKECAVQPNNGGVQCGVVWFIGFPFGNIFCPRTGREPAHNDGRNQH